MDKQPIARSDHPAAHHTHGVAAHQHGDLCLNSHDSLLIDMTSPQGQCLETTALNFSQKTQRDATKC